MRRENGVFSDADDGEVGGFNGVICTRAERVSLFFSQNLVQNGSMAFVRWTQELAGLQGFVKTCTVNMSNFDGCNPSNPCRLTFRLGSVPGGTSYVIGR